MVRLGYMSWLDDQISKSNEAKSRESLLKEHAFGAYTELWNSVSAIVAEASQKLRGPDLTANGSARERKVSARTSSSERTLTLTISADERKIKASFPGKTVEFEIGVDPGGIVCIMQNESIVSAQEAAQIIMGPFLFPELHGNPTGFLVGWR